MSIKNLSEPACLHRQGRGTGETVNKKKDMWINKSNVTEEAIKAVIGHMYFEIPKGENSFAYAVRLNDGKYARLTLEVSDECPEWAREQLEGKDGEQT